MHITEVGKLYPDPRYFAQEGAQLQFFQTGADFVAAASNLTAEEISEWKRGAVTVAIFATQHVPFLIFKCKSLSFDAPGNFLKIPPENRGEWLSGEFNLIRFILIEQRTGMVKAMRALGIRPPLVDALKAALSAQPAAYPQGASHIDQAIRNISRSYSTETMMSRGVQQKFAP